MEKLLCPTCKTINEKERAYCWVCYKKLGELIQAPQNPQKAQVAPTADSAPSEISTLKLDQNEDRIFRIVMMTFVLYTSLQLSSGLHSSIYFFVGLFLCAIIFITSSSLKGRDLLIPIISSIFLGIIIASVLSLLAFLTCGSYNPKNLFFLG